MAAQNLAWVRAPVTWGMIPGWVETLWSIEVMDPGLVSEGFLIDPLECLPLIPHGLMWDFTNMQTGQGENFLILLSFLGITPLLYIMKRDLKDQWFSLWCQTRASYHPVPKGPWLTIDFPCPTS